MPAEGIVVSNWSYWNIGFRETTVYVKLILIQEEMSSKVMR